MDVQLPELSTSQGERRCVYSTESPVYDWNGGGRKGEVDGEGRPLHLWHGPKRLLPDWLTFSLLPREMENDFNYPPLSPWG